MSQTCSHLLHRWTHPCWARARARARPEAGSLACPQIAQTDTGCIVILQWKYILMSAMYFFSMKCNTWLLLTFIKSCEVYCPSGNIKLKKSTVETLVTSCPARWEPNIALGNTLHPLHYSSFNFSSGWNINVTVILVELKRSTRANMWSGYLGPITRAGVAAPTWRLPSNGVRRACVPTFQLSEGQWWGGGRTKCVLV